MPITRSPSPQIRLPGALFFASLCLLAPSASSCDGPGGGGLPADERAGSEQPRESEQALLGCDFVLAEDTCWDRARAAYGDCMSAVLMTDPKLVFEDQFGWHCMATSPSSPNPTHLVFQDRGEIGGSLELSSGGKTCLEFSVSESGARLALPGAELAGPTRGPGPKTVKCGDEPAHAFAPYEELEQTCGREYINEFRIGGFVSAQGDFAFAEVPTIGGFKCLR